MSDAASSPRFLTRRLLLRGCCVGLIGGLGLEVGNILVGPNCRTVIPGVAYRTSQPSAARLEHLIKTYGIRTVVNFRGVCEEAEWYRKQCRVTSQNGVSEEDLNGVSASRLPSVPTIRALVEILDRIAYPILFHCNRGIDRTGMASVIILLLKTTTPVAEARRQLGLRYGHLSIGKTGNIDFFFDLYEEWLAQGHGPHSSEVFHHWMAAEYCPGPCRATIVPLDSPNLPARMVQPFRIHCTNTSVRPWRLRPGLNAGIHAVYFVDDTEGKSILQGRSGLFDAVVAPGESIIFTLALPALAPGKYLLRADMIDEQNGEFLQLGSVPLILPLEVQ